MNTSQLECFVQVAQNLNFRQAAEELHLAQPTVSKQIRSLEEELGGALFVRTTRSVVLTALGESFLADAQEILRLSYASARRARQKADGSVLALGYSDPNELMRLGYVLDLLKQETPHIHVNLHLGPRDDNITKLSREQLDLVSGFEALSLTTGGIEFIELATEGLSCIVRNDSPLAQYSELGPKDVEGIPQVICVPTSLQRRGYSAQQVLPKTNDQTTYCATTSEAFCLVNAGFGYALVPTLMTMPDPHHRAIPWKSTAQATYGLYQRKGHQETKAFCSLAKKCFTRISSSPTVFQPRL